MAGAFKGRNLYYLRLKGTVLPLYVFLDEKHIKWMNDITLQRVLSDLRPRIISELTDASAKASKTKITTVRGDEYQFCYFFRNGDHHSVLLKRRFYTTEPSTANKGKRKLTSKDAVNTEVRRKSKRKRRERQDMEVDSDAVSAEDAIDVVAMGNEESESSPSTRDLPGCSVTPTDLLATDNTMDLEPEEEKPKPRVRLTYEGLRLGDQCLCVVVEPAEKQVNGVQRGPPLVPADAASGPEREPLFLPEQDHNVVEDQPSATVGDMMTFSQRLHAIVDYTVGAVDDEEDAEGDVFLGDADDARDF